MSIDWLIDLAREHALDLTAGAVGGLIGGSVVASMRYLAGWRRAKLNLGSEFHIAATLYVPVETGQGHDRRHQLAQAHGKQFIQELYFLGPEIALSDFLTNPYILSRVEAAMNAAKNEGLLIGGLEEDCERPLLKKIAGYHATIPASEIVTYCKRFLGQDVHGMTHGIAPPTHENYPGSPHRRVLRALFISEHQLTDGLPPLEHVFFENDQHQHRYQTLATLITLYRDNPERFARCHTRF